jgi:DNA-binding HxlR family transcriptional regulator
MNDLEQKATEVANLLKLLAHPKRFLILCQLREGAKNVGELERVCTI